MDLATREAAAPPSSLPPPPPPPPQCVLYISLSWRDDRALEAVENSTAAYADPDASGDCRRPCDIEATWTPGDKCCETMWLPQFGEPPAAQRARARWVPGRGPQQQAPRCGQGEACRPALARGPRSMPLTQGPLRAPDFTNVLAFSQDRQIRDSLMLGPDGAVAWVSFVQGCGRAATPRPGGAPARGEAGSRCHCCGVHARRARG